MENKNEKEITIKVDGKDWEKLVDAAFKKANSKAKISGFRPGKAPKEIFIKHYGMEGLYYEASNKAVEVAYEKMLTENEDLDIVSQPSVDMKDIGEDGAEFVFTVTLKPIVKLGKYTGLKAKKEKAEVTKDEISDALDKMREKYKENVIKEGTIEKGNIAVIDFEGYKDGVPFDGGKGEDYSLEIGSDTFIPGFEEKLIGLSSGDEKDIELSFPDDYHSEDLKGKEVVFKVKIKEVKEIHVPDLDEEFFNDLGMEGIDTKEALESQIKENILAQKERQTEDDWLNNLLEEASTTMEVDIPDAMIKDEVKRMIEEYGQNLQMQGINLETFYQFTGMSEEKLEAEYQDQATKRVKYRLMIEAIINKESIDITDKELDEEVSIIATKYQMTKEEFFKNFGEEMVKYDLKVRKVFDMLKGTK